MEDYSEWREAGRIAGEALKYGKALIKPGARITEVLDKIEEKIYSLGGKCAFPPQISMNDVAAHYCPEPGDEFCFKDELCSLDLGVHVNGAIGDTACTVDLSGNNQRLVEAAEKAIDAAIEKAAIGVKLSEIGAAIQETISDHGFAPVRNLSGHGLGRFKIHDEPSVPNYNDKGNTVLKKGMTVAIEPFATTGQGLIHEADDATIFSLINKKPVRNIFTRQILKEIESYNDLPFTTRWLARKFPMIKVNFALKELLQNNIIKAYPPLVEVAHGLVSQAEHSLLIDDKVEVLTRV
ncbi:type II methionyl aminopeptidase [Candidatus Woesearchaeota archaeon]|nr:type II methionyl aminopeptidase [Candidatus Woesearchaeota archaeon]